MENKVSIVVPVYQTKKYLSKCIKSILDQTYKDIEIILVNDGSTDGSKELCDDYTKKHSNITVIHQQNQGVSKARNVGIEYSTGNFIMFLDSDDYIDSKMVETLMEVIVTSNADIAFCNFSRIFEDNIEHVKCDIKEGAYTSIEFKNIYFDLLNADIINNIGTKLYRKKNILSHKIKFRESLSIREDIIFCLEVIIRSEIFYFVNENYYKYTQFRTDESLMSTYKKHFFEANEILMSKMKSFLFNNDTSKNLTNHYYKYYFNSIIGLLVNEASYNENKIDETVKKIKKSNNFIAMEGHLGQCSFKEKVLYYLIKLDLKMLLRWILIFRYAD